MDDSAWELPILRDILTPVWDFNSLTIADEQLYEEHNRKMSFSDMLNAKAPTPWTKVQMAQLYHLLAGNLVLPTGQTAYKTYRDYNGALVKELRDVQQVIKLSPSFMDAVSLLSNPGDTVAQRLLPPYKQLGDWLNQLAAGKPLTWGMAAADIPVFGSLSQRLGLQSLVDPTVKNPLEKTADSGLMLNMLPSLFSTAYTSPIDPDEALTAQQYKQLITRRTLNRQRYGLTEGYSPVRIYTYLQEQKHYPKTIKVRKTRAYNQITNYYRDNYTNYHGTQRSIDRRSRSTLYLKHYTQTGYSRLELQRAKTTGKNLKYKIQNIKAMYRYR